MGLRLVVKQLKAAREVAAKQLESIELAMAALGRKKAAGRVLSVAARKKMSVAQKARWAKWHKDMRSNKKAP